MSDASHTSKNPPPAQILKSDGKGRGGQGKANGTGKGKGKDTNNDIRKQGIVEHHGVMIKCTKKNLTNPGNGLNKSAAEKCTYV